MQKIKPSSSTLPPRGVVARLTFVLAVSCIFLLFSSGCQQRLVSASPEQAAVQQIAGETSPDVVVDVNSIRMAQRQVFEESTYVLLTYRRQLNSRAEDCLMMTETHRELFGWLADSSSGLCAWREDEAAQVEPLELSGGWFSRADQKKPDVVCVMGRVNDPSIVKVIITWQDGRLDEIAVRDGTVLMFRTGGLDIEMKFAAGLNEEGDVVHSIQH